MGGLWRHLGRLYLCHRTAAVVPDIRPGAGSAIPRPAHHPKSGGPTSRPTLQTRLVVRSATTAILDGVADPSPASPRFALHGRFSPDA